MTELSPEERFSRMLLAYSEYPREAYAFLFDALDHSVRNVHSLDQYDQIKNDDLHHVGAQELLESVRQYAMLEFGCLAGCVFDSWGVVASEDVGMMVFHLIEYQLLGKKETDRVADFDRGFGGLTFHEVFSIEPQLEYCQEKDEWIASYRSAS
ncbi:MAG: Minf_1886 family protein [Planctomycetota bacterium]